MGQKNLLGTFEQVILLSVLRIGEEAYPPLVRDELERGLGRKVSRGSVYVTLDRLETKGLLSSTPGPTEPGRGGRPKRVLAVTEEGLAALRQARESLFSFWSGVEALLEE
jgi:DNA-binding PadR family transcriptional regulator